MESFPSFPSFAAVPRADCTYNNGKFIQTVQQQCAPFISSLQTCPTVDVSATLRLEAADSVNSCLNSVYRTLSNAPAFYAPVNPTESVNISAKAGCSYPDFIPILQAACEYDFTQIDNYCPIDEGTAVDYRVKEYFGCQQQSTIQYVRCTLQKTSDQVADCVVDNAQKVDWLVQMQGYGGADSCPNVNTILVVLALTVLRNALGPVFQYFFRLFGRRLVQRAKERKGAAHPVQQVQVYEPGKAEGLVAGDPSQYTYETHHGVVDAPLRLAEKYTLKATRLCEAVGKEVLTAYLTSLVMRQYTQFGAPSFTDNLLLYVVRPRAAPLTGVLGLFEPWSQQGIADLVVDGLLSGVAGTMVGVRFLVFAAGQPATANPAAPQQGLRVLEIGAVLTAAPTFAALLITMFQACCCLRDRKGRRYNNGLLWDMVMWALYLAAIGVFIALIPFFALWEMGAAVVHKLRHRKDTDEQKLASRKKRWRITEPLTFSGMRILWVYRFFLASSWCINIGNWIFWASYLKLEGELYCPTQIQATEAMWVLVPLGIDLFFWTFRLLTGDSTVSFHDQQADSDQPGSQDGL